VRRGRLAPVQRGHRLLWLLHPRMGLHRRCRHRLPEPSARRLLVRSTERRSARSADLRYQQTMPKANPRISRRRHSISLGAYAGSSAGCAAWGASGSSYGSCVRAGPPCASPCTSVRFPYLLAVTKVEGVRLPLGADPVRPCLYRGITKRTLPPATARQRLTQTRARRAIVLAHRAVRHPGPLGPAAEAPSSGSVAAAVVAAGVGIAWALLGASRRQAVASRA
jgi:hypothetical protein